MIGCTASISVSALHSRYNILALASWTMTCLTQIQGIYYELKPLESDDRTTLVLSNTRELDRDPFTK